MIWHSIRRPCLINFPDLGDPAIAMSHGLPEVLVRRCPVLGDKSSAGSRLATGVDRDRPVRRCWPADATA
jgi:hypothetical protein